MQVLSTKTFPSSGLGDRLCAMAMLVIYAHVKNFSRLCLNWPDYCPPKFKGADFRAKDITLENVQAHIGLPACVQIVQLGDIQGTVWKGELGIGAVSVEWLRSTYMPEATAAQVEDSVLWTRLQFSWKDNVLSAINPLIAAPFIGIHLRRTDMNQAMPVADLEPKTLKHVNALLAAGYRRFFVSTDSPSEASSVTERLCAAGSTLITLPPMEDWQSTYYHLALLAHAHIILQSCRTSAFSNFAHFLSGGQLVNVETPADYSMPA